MQLYILDRDPGRAVRFLADVHVIKMCLETMQIVAGVIHNFHLPPVPGMLKPYNPSHPVIRAVDSPEKLNWVLLYNWDLQCEYLLRFKKRHGCFDLSVRSFYLLWQSGYGMDCENLARSFKDFSSDESDIVQAFREYYRFKKSRIKRWKYTAVNEPEWLA